MKKAFIFSIALLLSMTFASSCFCAHEAGSSNVVSFQKAHNCCHSDSDTHCKAHMTGICHAEYLKPLVVSVSESRIDHQISPVLFFSNRIPFDSSRPIPYSLVAFPKIQDQFFLKTEVLRI